MTGPISRNRLIGSLEEAASWPGAARNTVVTLATALVAARAPTRRGVATSRTCPSGTPPMPRRKLWPASSRSAPERTWPGR